MTKEKNLIIPVSIREKEALVKKSLKAGYRSLAAYMRDKAMESDETSTLKKQNGNLMRLLSYDKQEDSKDMMKKSFLSIIKSLPIDEQKDLFNSVFKEG